MTEQTQLSAPTASWGHVAREALKHPFETGAYSVVLGTTELVAGVAMQNPILMGLGVTLDVLAGPHLARFIRKARHDPAAPAVH